MIRNIMRNLRKQQGQGQPSAERTGTASVRAGMHRGSGQGNRGLLQADEDREAAAVVTLPAEIEAEIPPIEESDDAVVAEIAEGSIRVETIPAEGGSDEDAVTVSIETADDPADGIPVLEPVTGGVNCEPCVVVYDPGDGIPRAIPDPLGILGEIHFE